MKILIVEDSDSDARLLDIYMSKIQGTDRIRTNSLVGALELLSNNRFDVILLDLGLPDSKGINTLDKVVGVDPYTPIVVLTSNEDYEYGVQSVRHGATDYIVKADMNPNIIRRVLFQSMERHRLRRVENNLIYASIEASGGESRSSLDLFGQHSLKLIEALNSIRSYAYVNLPSDKQDEIEEIFSAFSVDTAMQGLRNIMDDRPRDKRISSTDIERELDRDIKVYVDNMPEANAKEYLDDVLSMDPDRPWNE